MALIRFKIDNTQNPPQVVTPDVLNLHPNDRLLFEPPPAAPGGQVKNVYVNLGNQETGTLVALVKFKGEPNFDVDVTGDGDFVVTLRPPTGAGPEPDAP